MRISKKGDLERNDSASREGRFLLNRYPGSSSLPSYGLLGNKNINVRVVAFTPFIFVSREKASRNPASPSLIDEINAAWKADPQAKIVVGSDTVVETR